MDAAERDTLRTEIAILKLVRHPNIVSFADMFETPKKIFIVMNLVNGGDLFDRIQLRRRFTEDNARYIACQCSFLFTFTVFIAPSMQTRVSIPFISLYFSHCIKI